MRRAHLALAALVVLAAGAATWRFSRPSGSPDVAPRAAPPPATAVTSAPPAAATAPAPAVDPPIPGGAAFVASVRWPEGRPAAGATVAMYPATEIDRGSWSLGGRFYPSRDSTPPVNTATTGPAGRVGFAGLTTGRWRLVVDAPGAARTEVETAWVAGGPPREIAIDLQPGHEVAVSVTDHRCAPASGAEVIVAAESSRFGPSDATRTWRATTGADGTCRISGLPAGLLEVWASGGGGASPVGGTPVRVPEVARVELQLADTGLLKGRVVDPHGIGVGGAQLVFRSDADLTFSSVEARGATGPDGSFAIRTKDAWAGIQRIDVRAAGFATQRNVVEQVRVPAGQVHEFPAFELRTEGRVEGKVTGPDGPVAGAQVEVLSKGTGHFGEMESDRGETRADGSYSVGGLASGTVVVNVHAEGLVQEGSNRYGQLGEDTGDISERDLGSVTDSAKVEVREGDTVTRDVTLVRTAESALIRATFAGVVRLADGTPVPWASVWASGSANHCWIHDAGHTITDAEGRFRFEAEAAAGDFTLSAAAPGLGSPREPRVTVNVARSETHEGFALVVEPTPFVRGIVRSKLGLPVAGARVTAGTHHFVKFSETATWDEQLPVTAAADGTFVLPLGPRQMGGSDHDSQGAEIVVCAEAPGHAPGISKQFTWDDAARGAVVEIELDAGAGITGRVVDEQGRGLADVAITLEKKGGRWNNGEWPPAYPPMPEVTVWTRTASDGAFRIEHLMPSAYEVGATRAGLLAASAEVTAPATGVELRLAPAREIAGVVVSPDGVPLAHAEVTLHREAGQERGRRIETDATGAFRYTDIESGAWFLSVVAGRDDMNILPLEIPVTAGTTGLRIATKPGLTIAGSLVDAAGAPVAKAGVSGHRVGDGVGARSYAETDERGRFTLNSLAAGKHEIELSIDDRGIEFGTFDAGATVPLRLSGTQTISGTVRANDRETPGFIATLRARPAERPAGAPGIVHTCRSDIDTGAFEFRNLAPGRYEVEVSDTWTESEGSSRPPLTRIVLSAGTRDVVLNVEPPKVEEK